MSRSVHTQPRRIRAPRRVREPHARRSQGDPNARRSLARTLKSWGIVLEPGSGSAASERTMPLPRIRVKRARKGYHHALGRSNIIDALKFFGETCTYGLRSIELSFGPARFDHKLSFGKLIVPGQIVLNAVPLGPWSLPGRLNMKPKRQLEHAGATVELAASGMHTLVSWPGNSLRDFMLFDVLMHEIGHHLIQHYKGKRRIRMARTKDHEAFATHFARRCRALYKEDRVPDP